ncbi:MAG: hypothetical protein EHM85_07040 [Desulfobacteraceae bacterium]|nr:MAG: hypothetical protein EHM85_07040 [Desulfobacteraceae bacterium]
MSLKPYQEKIIQQMIDQELLISELYALFAKDFPQYSAFWTELSGEEKKHADLISKLEEAEKKGLVFFDEGKTKSYTLTVFISHLEKQCQKAKNKEFDIAAAFSSAFDLEQALIEKDVFTRFDSLTEKTGSVMNRLRTETKKHMEKIRLKRKEISDITRQ